MRVVVYNVGGVETKSYTEMKALEKKLGVRAETTLREVKEKAPELSPIRKAMLEQFGYVSAKLHDKVVLQ